MTAFALAEPARTPAAPGPGPVSPGVLRSLDVAVRRRIDSLVPGDNLTSTVGAGTELSQIRPYQPGDDVRQIDWNVTARTQEPHVRVHVGERSLTTWLVLSTGSSMRFGTADRRKIDVAEGVALAMGNVATRRGNRLGVVAVRAEATHLVPPRQGRLGLLTLLAAARTEPDADGLGPAPLAAGLVRLAAAARSRGMICVVSDLLGPRDWVAPLRALHERHGVMVVEIRDPREQELVPMGTLMLQDPASGRQLEVDTNSRKLRRRFADAAAADRADVAQEIRSVGADHLVLSTSGDWLRELATHLRRTERAGHPGAGQRAYSDALGPDGGVRVR